jgi:hypothetical protein
MPRLVHVPSAVVQRAFIFSALLHRLLSPAKVFVEITATIIAISIVTKAGTACFTE